ncbi:hypothetical protein [Sulfurimonas sp.]
MLDIVIYFFRRQRLLFYFGLLSLTIIYSYFLAIYFLNISSFERNIFNLLTAFSFLWCILFYVSFNDKKQTYTYDREKEKYKLLRHQMTLKYKLDIKDDVFSRIDLITTFMKENFSSRGLLSIRMLKVTNASLSLYIENLKIKMKLYKALSLSQDSNKKEFYQKEIEKNTRQNMKIIVSLDNFIKELLSKSNNDNQIDNLLDEFEDSTKILIKIKQR